MINFVNLNIKPVPYSFRGVHRDRIYMHIFIWMITHTYMSIYIYTVFLQKFQPYGLKVTERTGRKME
jgi:hypothetical protein